MAAHTQKVKNKPLTGPQGLLFILVTVIFFYVLGKALGKCQLVFGWSYSTAVCVLWAIGILLTLAVMNDRVLSYNYVLDGSNLTFERLYGSYVRQGRTIMFRSIEDIGSLEEMKKKYPGSRTERYMRRQCDIEPVALVHISDNHRYICLFQPDDEILSAIAARKK